MRYYLALPRHEADAVMQLSLRDGRNLKDQLHHLVRQALRAEGLLPTDPKDEIKLMLDTAREELREAGR